MAREMLPVYVCDGCKKTQVGELTDGVYGYVGTVTGHHESGGGEGGDWFACSSECIGNATIAVCEASLEQWDRI